MKNRNQRELEKHWAEQQKKAEKKSSPPAKKTVAEKPAEEPHPLGSPIPKNNLY